MAARVAIHHAVLDAHVPQQYIDPVVAAIGFHNPSGGIGRDDDALLLIAVGHHQRFAIHDIGIEDFRQLVLEHNSEGQKQQGINRPAFAIGHDDVFSTKNATCAYYLIGE